MAPGLYQILRCCGLVFLFLQATRIFVVSAASYSDRSLPAPVHTTNHKNVRTVPEFSSYEVNDGEDTFGDQEQMNDFGRRGKSDSYQREYPNQFGQKFNNFEQTDQRAFDASLFGKNAGKEIVKKECGINVDNFKNSRSEDRNLNKFCYDSSIHTRNERNVQLKSYEREEVRNCHSFLCGWHLEKCDHTILMEQRNPHSQIDIIISDLPLDQALQKCNCVHRLFVQSGCKTILDSDDISGLPQVFKTGTSVKHKDGLMVTDLKPERYVNAREEDLTKAEIDLSFNKLPKRRASAFVVPVVMKKRSNDWYKDEDYQNDGAIPHYTEQRSKYTYNVAPQDSDSFVFGESASGESSNIDKTVSPFTMDTYSKEEKDCFSMQMVLYEGSCVELNKKCGGNDGMSLVLDKPSSEGSAEALKAVCKEKKCQAKDEIWWPADERCKKASEAKRSCIGKNTIVKPDAFGEGYCTCIDGHSTYESSADCYQFYLQGPCQPNQVFTFNTTSFEAVCSPDLCLSLNNPTLSGRRLRRDETAQHHVSRYGLTRQNGHEFDLQDYDLRGNNQRLIRQINRAKPKVEPKKKYGPMYGTGACYRFGSSDPCTGTDARFVVHNFLKVPGCFENTQSLHLIDSRPSCKADGNNNCREEVKLAQSSGSDFLNSLKNQARNKRDMRGR